MKPKRFALTPGEPAGIGPDLCLLLASQAQPHPLIAITSRDLLLERAAQLGVAVDVISVTPDQWPDSPAPANSLYVWDTPLNAPVTAGKLDQANAAVAEASEQLEQTVVRAPYSGILQQRFVEIGELAVPGKPLLRGLSLEHLRLTARLPQSQLPAVQNSQQAELVLDNGQVLAISTPKLTIAPQADSQSHSFALRLELPKADYRAQQLYPGSWQRLRLQTGSAEQLLASERVDQVYHHFALLRPGAPISGEAFQGLLQQLCAHLPCRP